MSLYSQLQADASSALETLAQMTGKEKTASGNTLFRNGQITVLYGTPRVAEPMNPGGGFRPRVELTASVTRTQLNKAPVPGENMIRVDLTPHITYRIDTVDVHSPLFYVMVLVKVGE